jgi:hypothetical protein
MYVNMNVCELCERRGPNVRLDGTGFAQAGDRVGGPLSRPRDKFARRAPIMHYEVSKSHSDYGMTKPRPQQGPDDPSG